MVEHFRMDEGARTILMIGGAAIIGTLARWRNWHNPADMKMADGSVHPNAGKLSRVKIVGDFVFVPALTLMGTSLLKVSGVLHMDWLAAGIMGFVVVCALLGSAFFLATFEKVRDAAIAAAVKRLGGGE